MDSFKDINIFQYNFKSESPSIRLIGLSEENTQIKGQKKFIIQKDLEISKMFDNFKYLIEIPEDLYQIITQLTIELMEAEKKFSSPD